MNKGKGKTTETNKEMKAEIEKRSWSAEDGEKRTK
jgi:hypothetical protein